MRRTVTEEKKLDFRLTTKVFDENKSETCTVLSGRNDSGTGYHENNNSSCVP